MLLYSFSTCIVALLRTASNIANSGIHWPAKKAVSYYLRTLCHVTALARGTSNPAEVVIRTKVANMPAKDMPLL